MGDTDCYTSQKQIITVAYHICFNTCYVLQNLTGHQYWYAYHWLCILLVVGAVEMISDEDDDNDDDGDWICVSLQADTSEIGR